MEDHSGGLPGMRDYRELRDWARPWRDPPGWFTPATGTNSCCSSPCTVGCPAVGTVGTESGSECSACSTSVVSDDFSGDLSSWIGYDQFPGGGTACLGKVGGSSINDFTIVSGRLTQPVSPTGICILRSFSRPALSGLCIEVKATVYYHEAALETGAAGITLALGRMFFGRPAADNYGRQSCPASSGCVLGTSNFATGFGPSPADGDVVSFIIRDEGGGDEGDGSIYVSICYKVNGTVYRVEEGVLWCPPETCYAGVVTTLNQSRAEWDDFEVRTS